MPILVSCNPSTSEWWLGGSFLNVYRRSLPKLVVFNSVARGSDQPPGFEQFMRGILEAVAEDLRIQGRLDVREAFIDGSFAPAKSGSKIGKTIRGKGTKIIAVADRHGLPVAVSVGSATPHEVKLVTSTLV